MKWWCARVVHRQNSVIVPMSHAYLALLAVLVILPIKNVWFRKGVVIQAPCDAYVLEYER